METKASKNKKMSWFGRHWLDLIALFISMVALWFSYRQNHITRRLAHLHLDPSVKAMFDLPKEGNPVFVITNDGDTAIVSLSVFHNVYLFDAKKQQIVSAAKTGKWLGDRMIYREELKPSEYEQTELLGVNAPDTQVSIYEFNIRYYRPEDMKLYTKRELYFIMDRRAFAHVDFRTNPYYSHIMDSIDRFDFPQTQYDPGKLKTILESWDKSKP